MDSRLRGNDGGGCGNDGGGCGNDGGGCGNDEEGVAGWGWNWTQRGRGDRLVVPTERLKEKGEDGFPPSRE